MSIGRFATVLVLSALLVPGGVKADEPLELAVKATYLYKLAPFVTRPASA